MNIRRTDIFNHDLSGKLDHKKNDKSRSTSVPSKIFTHKYNDKKNISYKIRRLHKLISDPMTRENEIWINRLLNSCLQEIRHKGYKLKYLSAVIDVLQFLSWKSNDILEYKQHLNEMIELCAYPPLLETFSESLLHSEILENYFTVLGYLTILLPCQKQVINILRSLNKLFNRSTPSNSFAIKFEMYCQSIEKSELPLIFVKLIEISPPAMYTKVLDTTYILASISEICCHKMLKAGILNHLLLRMNEQSLFDIVEQLEQENMNINESIIVINILLLLMNSIFPLQTSNIIEQKKIASSISTRPLKNIFQQLIVYNNTNYRVLIIRNNLATIFLMKLIALPSLPIVDFDLIEEFLQIVFKRKLKCHEDFLFRKILFSVLCQLSYFDGLSLIMKNCCVIEKTLQFLNENINYLTASEDSSSFNHLFLYSLRMLTFLVPKMPEEFIKYNNSIYFLKIFHSSMTGQVNFETTFEIVKTLCSIVTFTCSNSLVQFQEVVPIFLNTICFLNRLTIFNQKTLILICIIIDTIITSHFKVISMYGNKIVGALLKLLKYCKNKKDNHFITDDRLLIGIGACLWSCVIKSSGTIEKLLEMSGLYSILDLIDETNYIVQNVYLGLFADLCLNPYCIPHICTWRGTDKNTLISLLVRVWKDEESRIGVKRTESGCIADVELPLMGINQRHESFHLKIHDDYSPAISRMFGFIRPKVYSIRKILLNNSEICEKSLDYYKILLCNISIEDSITFCIVDQFFRFVQGQVWAEVIRYIRESGTIPAGNDGEMLLVMRQRHRKFALHVRDRQNKILRDIKRSEMIKEQNELVKTRNMAVAVTPSFKSIFKD